MFRNRANPRLIRHRTRRADQGGEASERWHERRDKQNVAARPNVIIQLQTAILAASAASQPRTFCTVGEWLSLVEHLVRDQGVGGSNPLSPTNLFLGVAILPYPHPPHL